MDRLRPGCVDGGDPRLLLGPGGSEDEIHAPRGLLGPRLPVSLLQAVRRVARGCLQQLSVCALSRATLAAPWPAGCVLGTRSLRRFFRSSLPCSCGEESFSATI